MSKFITEPLNRELAEQWQNDRPAAIKRIAEAFEQNEGNFAKTARALGTSVDSLRRWALVSSDIASAVRRGRVKQAREFGRGE